MKKTILLGAIISALSLNASAETPSFNFVEGGYTDGFDSASPDGFELKGNFEIDKNLYFSAEYQDVSETDSGDKVDLTAFFLGLGFKSEISNNAVFFAQLDYAKVESDIELGGLVDLSSSENGYQASFGVRSNVVDNLEMSAAVRYIDIVASDTYADFGAVYSFTDALGVYANVETDFSDSAYAVGLRYSF